MSEPRWTAEQVDLIATYGACSTCGAPRDSKIERDEEGRPTALYGVCTADESHAAWG